MRALGRAARLALVCGIGMSTSGCFINALLSLVLVTGGEEHVDTLITLQASANVRSCSDLTGASHTVSAECTYGIGGQDVGSAFQLASTAGILGMIIDPLILQVPTTAGNFSGTFGGTGFSGSLSIIEVPGSLPADLDTMITPQAGTKLVIVDFPHPPPPLNQSFGFTLNFQLPGDATPVPLKALFAARVESNGHTFFVPLLPCEANFADIPTITLPQSTTFQNVSLPLTGVLGCAGTVFRLSDVAHAIPTLSTWVALLLGAAMAGYGAYLLRLRYRDPELHR